MMVSAVLNEPEGVGLRLRLLLGASDGKKSAPIEGVVSSGVHCVH
jgi:hypothetical protein